MKKVNFKNALVALVLAMVFLVVGTERADAQVSTTLTGVVPAAGVILKSPTQAQAVLQSELLDLKASLGGMTPGTPVYNATLLQANYYRGILAGLTAGQSVAEAIQSGLSYAGYPTGNFGTASSVPKAQLVALMQDATSLLKA